MTKQYWLHVEDLADAYIGPFETPDYALAHHNWCRNVRDDGAVLLSLSDQPPPAGAALVLTPQQDRADGVWERVRAAEPVYDQDTCKHEWNMTAAQADEAGPMQGIRCVKCGADGDA